MKPMDKINVMVEMNSYCNAYGLTKDEKVRTSWGDCKDWEEMVVTREQLVDMINKCVKLSIVE